MKVHINFNLCNLIVPYVMGKFKFWIHWYRYLLSLSSDIGSNFIVVTSFLHSSSFFLLFILCLFVWSHASSVFMFGCFDWIVVYLLIGSSYIHVFQLSIWIMYFDRGRIHINPSEDRDDVCSNRIPLRDHPIFSKSNGI